MRKILIGLAFLLPQAWGADSAPPSGFKISEVFSAEKNPGKGTLSYTLGGSQTESISFGDETGHYLIGLVFPLDTLPEAMRSEFKNKELIQLAMGTLSASLGNRIAQFGAMTVAVTKGARTVRQIPLSIPSNSDRGLSESGLLLFSSPQMPAQISDEEKLRGTFFGKGGSIGLSASTPPTPLNLVAEGKKVGFKVQSMRMELQASLSTPFNSEERQLSGKVEFALFYPDGVAAKRLLSQLAETAFNSKYSVQIPEEMGKQRQITSKPR